jgi:hypothetical protein
MRCCRASFLSYPTKKPTGWRMILLPVVYWNLSEVLYGPKIIFSMGWYRSIPDEGKKSLGLKIQLKMIIQSNDEPILIEGKRYY